MTRTLHYFRYAFSISCGIVAVLLLVLWVRSYYQVEDITFRGEHRITSFNGHVYLDAAFIISGEVWQSQTIFRVRKVPWNKIEIRRLPLSKRVRGVPLGTITVETDNFGVPYWLLVTLFPILGFCSWLRVKRFSLRTLLIATTLVAVVLGLVVWSS